MERLEPRTLPVWLATTALRTTILGAVFVAVAYWASATTDLGVADVTVRRGAIGLAALTFVGRLVVTWLRFRVFRFEVRGDSLYIERGVFTRVKTVVPFVRLQHVDSQRSPVERAVDLATLVVYTAGSRSADVSIPGLTPARAEGLREELKRLATESEGEDAV